MIAKAVRFLRILGDRPCQFVIPIYQRTYSWTNQECRQFWDDIVHIGGADERSIHFVGSIVHIEDGPSNASGVKRRYMIDGQQRLTTLTLILEALARQLEDNELLEVPSARKLRSKYILNLDEEGEDAFKLLLSQTDKASLLALVQQKPQPDGRQSLRIMENFSFFEEQIKELGEDLPVLYRGLEKLVVVDIVLHQGEDNPQLIFESMNSTGLELSKADLIRNFVLMGLEIRDQTRLYEDYWRPMEEQFGQENYGPHFDRFMRHYLTLKNQKIPNIRDVYKEFKSYANKPEIAEKGIDALVVNIQTFAKYYCAMALGKETNKQLAKAFRDLCELKVDVAYPFLLDLYDDFANGRLEANDFESAVRLIEAYVFRRAVCGLSANSLNTTFATFGRALRKDQYLESIQAHLLTLPYNRRFPSNEKFKEELVVRDLYHFPRRSYWLRRMENHGRKEPISDEHTITIEHILPQNKNLSPEWQEELGPEWRRIQEDLVHTLGNLTLTGYNTEYSDHLFVEKCNMKGGFRESPLRLNASLGTLTKWDEPAINKRAEQLAEMAVDVWAIPSLSEEVLESYRPQDEERVDYTIDDHAHLSPDTPMREIFEAFRKKIMALDPCVKEQPRKLYIAYKTVTKNFIVIVPQRKRLRMTLNMQFNELHDPRGLAKNITNVGRWGSGDVEVGLNTIDEIPYVMSLVRQSFEKQMGNSEVNG